MLSLAGDVEIGLQERNGQLEVDIIQARGLTAKPGSKSLPGVGTAERQNFLEKDIFVVYGCSLISNRVPGTQWGSESSCGEVSNDGHIRIAWGASRRLGEETLSKGRRRQ